MRVVLIVAASCLVAALVSAGCTRAPAEEATDKSSLSQDIVVSCSDAGGCTPPAATTNTTNSSLSGGVTAS